MDKKILTVYTGGTICTSPTPQGRELSPALAKRALLLGFSQSNSTYSKYCEELFEDSAIAEECQTLSENMTLPKLWSIIEHIRGFDLNEYRGVIILHGTDTLAFSSAMMSFVFSGTPVSIMIVSGNRPPMDVRSNAIANFTAAVELIMNGIAPNVYVPYRNSDGVSYLHLGSALVQCSEYSEDFFSASNKSFLTSDEVLFEKCLTLSKKRVSLDIPVCLPGKAVLVYPYTGLDYRHIRLSGVKGCVHGVYHSGTVCVGRNNVTESYSTSSALYFAKRCKRRGIPLFLAPTRLDSEQYSSLYDLANSSDAVLLDMSTEAAYAKLVLGISKRLGREELKNFMKSEINNELGC